MVVLLVVAACAALGEREPSDGPAAVVVSVGTPKAKAGRAQRMGPTAITSASTTTTGVPTATTAGGPTTTSTTTSNTVPSGPAAGSSTADRRLFWGAYIDGDQTYDRYYASERNWEDAPWDLATWDRFERDAGKTVSVLHYGQPSPWQQGFVPDVADRVVARGAMPFIDMSSGTVPFADITAGRYDDAIRQWATGVREWGKPLFLRWNWEMNGAWFPWGAQALAHPASFVDSWRHVHDVVASAGALVTWVWCPNATGAAGTNVGSLYPGDEYVDWTCLDGYNWGQPWQSFDEIFRDSYDEVTELAPAKPMMIGETGSIEAGGSKAAWIDGMFASLPTMPAIRGLVWFNWRIFERGTFQEWPIESSTTAMAAFRRGIASSSFVADAGADLAPGQVAPPP